MTSKPQTGSKARDAPSLEEAVFLDLLRTSDVLSRRLAHVLKNEDLSSNQYNVLRILRGAPEGLPCGEIGSRMITRDPDITRLLDRLEKRGLIKRSRDQGDRRGLTSYISAAGLKMLKQLDEPVVKMHKSQLRHLDDKQQIALISLLES